MRAIALHQRRSRIAPRLLIAACCGCELLAGGMWARSIRWVDNFHSITPDRRAFRAFVSSHGDASFLYVRLPEGDFDPRKCSLRVTSPSGYGSIHSEAVLQWTTAAANNHIRQQYVTMVDSAIGPRPYTGTNGPQDVTGLNVNIPFGYGWVRLAQGVAIVERKWTWRGRPLTGERVTWVHVTLPYWLVSSVLALPGVFFIRPIVRRMQARFIKRRQPDACEGCGYDLRATPDRCPECGLWVRAQ